MDARPDGGEAYTPGNVTGFFWDTDKNSLQDPTNGKDIRLDGVAPRINSISMINTKAQFDSVNFPNKWYLKSGESISFELTTSEPVKISGDSSLRFRLRMPNNTYSPVGYDTTNFNYRKVTSSTIVYTLDVSRTTIPNDGILQNDITLVNPGNITDYAGNPVVVSSFTTALNTFNISNDGNGAGKTIYFDLTPPQKPVTTLTGGGNKTIGVDTDPAETLYYGATTPYFGVANVPSAQEPYGAETRQYSLNGGLYWVNFPTAINTTEYPWTTAVTSPAGNLYIRNGQWNLKTRYIDRAGNEGATTDQLIHVNSAFPKLLGVKVIQPNATYIAKNKLDFTLDFDDVVTVPATGVTLRLQDITNTTNAPDGVNNTYEMDVTATSGTSRTVTFTWSLVADTKDMLNGLKITALSISGLSDKFGNPGPSTGISFTNNGTGDNTLTVSGTGVTYNFSGIKVSTIKPTVRSREPQNANNRTGDITVFSPDPDTVSVSTIAKGSISSDNKTIRLNFSKPIQKGNGTITIRPHGEYAIPAVFENDGYYVVYAYDASGNVTGETKSSAAPAGSSTYVSGFYDIFNSINNTDKETLIGSRSMSAPLLSNITGLSVGPYKKMTHGLKQGAGYTGDYNNNSLGKNAPGAKNNTNDNADGNNNFMIPDVETKWVLDYQYNDLFSASGTVKNIRDVLDRAKWRWQEIAVTSANVNVSVNSVTIDLPEPLLPGLQWDVYYGDGTFEDTAGNPADGITRGNYWFWSKGVQKPVIRVNRRSYDARPGGATADYAGSLKGYYSANGYGGTNGIATFNTIYYRITSETPKANIFYAEQEGKEFTMGTSPNQVPIGSITAAWTGRVTLQAQGNALSNISSDATITWVGPKTGTNSAPMTIGSWVRPNLIFRNNAQTDQTPNGDGKYYIMEDIQNERGVRGIQATNTPFGNNNNNNRYYGFRSYNKDATFKELNNLAISTSYTAAEYAFGYSALEASKNYVAAQARKDHVHTEGTYNAANAVNSQKGFEGVFRTVIALNQDGLTSGSDGANPMTTGSHPIFADGSNIRSGMPTIAGFPIRDNGIQSDSRYTKAFYRDDKKFYWVTSEIVSPFFIQPYGNGGGGGSHGSTGDVEDWVTAGYGDLTYALNYATW